MDARDRSFQEAERWSDENVFGNRAYFRSSSRPAILAIENVLEADAAVYRCRVDFRVAQTRNAKVNLTVIGKRKQLFNIFTRNSFSVLSCKNSYGQLFLNKLFMLSIKLQNTRLNKYLKFKWNFI